MNATKRSFTILLIVVLAVVAFLLGSASVTGSVPSSVEAPTLTQWAAIQASNSLLLDQGPVGTYLPFVLRR